VTHTQQVALVVVAEEDAARRELLLLEHLPQVHFIARRIHDRLPPQVLLEDLVHAGILGLIDAVRKYDPGKNVLLKHYAEFRIRGAILDSLRQIDWSPRTLRRQGRRLERAVADCKGRFVRDPTEIEVAKELGMSLDQLHHLKRDLRGLEIGSLDAVADDSGRVRETCEYRPGSEEENPYHQTLRAEMKQLLGVATGELSDREREVLRLYHFEELTMKEVGAALGIGESRVSQVHTMAMLHLRSRLQELMANKNAPRATRPIKMASCAPNIPIVRLLRSSQNRSAEQPAIRRAS
jgi:RNA polymerase sigma factor for flagellar operon FliA